jgi:hypothetical protein
MRLKVAVQQGFERKKLLRKSSENFVYLHLKATTMKKLTALALSLFFVFASAFGQASFTSVSYNKTNQSALMLQLPYSESVVEDFIVANLKKTGYNAETKGKLFWKQNKLNGYYIFKEVQLKDLDHTVDLYFKVDQKGRKSKEECIVYMLVGKGEDYFIAKSDDRVYEAAKEFMNGFIDQAAAYKLELDIKEQEEVVKDAEKRMEKLKDNEKDIIKKQAELEKDLKKNRDDQSNQEKTIDEEQKKLLELKSKKTS